VYGGVGDAALKQRGGPGGDQPLVDQGRDALVGGGPVAIADAEHGEVDAVG
jgi:hypothetical protein